MVAVHYGNRKDDAEETVHEIRSDGGQAFSIGANLESLHGVENLYNALDTELQKRTGETQFDILINNAGIGPGALLKKRLNNF